MKLYIHTLGCRLNEFESDAIKESLTKQGAEFVNDAHLAECVIINTCTVTSKADQKARRLIRGYLKSSKVIITGCYAECDGDALKAEFPLALIVPGAKKQELLNYKTIQDFCLNTSDLKKLDPFDFFVTDLSTHARPMLKIQDGCNHNCAFCKTSIARGLPISLDANKVLERIQTLIGVGAHEIVLTGINLAAYVSSGANLASLLKQIVKTLPSDVYIRLSSLEPDLITPELLDVLQDEHIAPFFHLALQSVSQKVLEKAGRSGDYNSLCKLISALRDAKKNSIAPFISADIIAGLPYEEEQDAKLTYNFLRDMQFAKIHVFPFSPRKGTRYERTPHPAERIRDERAETLRSLSNQLYTSYYNSFVGTSLPCIAEDARASRQNFTTINYLKFNLPTASLNNFVSPSALPIVRGFLYKINLPASSSRNN